MYVVAPRRAVLVSPRPTALSFFSRSQMDTAVFLTVQAISVKSSATPNLTLRRLERAQTRKCPSRSHGEHDCSAARPTVGSDMPLIRPVSFWPSSRLLPFSILQSFVDLIGRVLGSDLGQLHRFAAHRVLSNARATDSRVIFSLEGTCAPTGRGPRCPMSGISDSGIGTTYLRVSESAALDFLHTATVPKAILWYAGRYEYSI